MIQTYPGDPDRHRILTPLLRQCAAAYWDHRLHSSELDGVRIDMARPLLRKRAHGWRAWARSLQRQTKRGAA